MNFVSRDEVEGNIEIRFVDLLYSKTKQKQNLKTALRFPAITCNSGQHFAGNGELFPV